MKKRSIRLFFMPILIILVCAPSVFSEVLVMNMNRAEFSSDELPKIFGYVLNDDLSAKPNNVTDIYLNDEYQETTETDAEGYYEFYLSELSEGEYNVTVSTLESSRTLSFEVYSQDLTPGYQVISPSLLVSYSNPVLNYTIEKYLGEDLSDDAINVSVFYENGTYYDSNEIISGVESEFELPQRVGLYIFNLDNKKSFIVSVAKFSLKYRIVDSGGNEKNKFKPGDTVYFELEGYLNGQKITNATVTADLTTPSGEIKTITFSESSEKYYGNTGVTATGAAVSLTSGKYKIEFKMEDSSNNQEKIIGFFTVYGLSVSAQLVEKKPYSSGQQAQFNVMVKKYSDGSLVNHSDVTYFLELVKDGKLYDSSQIEMSASGNPVYTSLFTFTVPETLSDGGYTLKVRASADGKEGRGREFIEVKNKNLFIELTDNYGGFREFLQPGELAKITARSNDIISDLSVSIYDRAGTQMSSGSASGSENSLSLTFNAPQTQKEYVARITATVGGTQMSEERWFQVQNYFSYLNIKDLDNQYISAVKKNTPFNAEIMVFDVANQKPVDLTGFTAKFEKIKNMETQKEYTSINAVENTTLSNRQAGILFYKISGLNIPDGPYEISYSLVNKEGKNFKGKGFFMLSAITVNVQTYDEYGQQKNIFYSGQTINISANIGTGDGTATINREFFAPLEFNISNGIGSVLLESADNLLPTEPGFYPFGLNVLLNTGEKGIGSGWFEIRSLNFRSINPSSNGEFSSGDDIVAEVVVEKSGSLSSGATISATRLIRSRDWKTIDFTADINTSDTNGRAAISIAPGESLSQGGYFVELNAEKGNEQVFGGFGFTIVGDKVTITVNDDDKKFSSTDTINLDVQVTDNDNNPREGVLVTLTGLLNLATWGPVPSNSQANTSSSGLAEIAVSAASFSAGRYAPIINVSGNENTFVGFGASEFEIKAIDGNIEFADNKTSYTPGEDIIINIDIVGSIEVDADVISVSGNLAQVVDTVYSDGVLSINNDLAPGDYFIDVTVTQSTKTLSKRLWCEIMPPWVNIISLRQEYSNEEALDFNYTAFTNGATGWHFSNATLVLESIRNIWTQEETNVDIEVSADGNGNYSLPLDLYNLRGGDYMLDISVEENPGFTQSLYFRVFDGVAFWPTNNITEDSVEIRMHTVGISEGALYTLKSIYNFKDFTTTNYNEENLDGIFALAGLENGFYRADIEINDEGTIYYANSFFDIRVFDVDITVPESTNVGDITTFAVNSSIASTFWILDPYTQSVLKKSPIIANPGSLQNFDYAFTYPGWFTVGFGNDKWEAFQYGYSIQARQVGFEVQWSWKNRYIVGNNISINITTVKNSTPVSLKIRSHLTGETQVYSLGTTPATQNEQKEYIHELDLLGPQDIEVYLEVAEKEKPRSMSFINVFPDQYDIYSWTNGWEFNAGDNVTGKIEAWDITTDMRATLDGITVSLMKSPMGSHDVPEIIFEQGTGIITVLTENSWASGNYHLELNATKDEISRKIPMDFYLKGNDNLQLNWFQNKWDVSRNEILQVTIDAFDSGVPAPNMEATLGAIEIPSNDWNTPPSEIEIDPNAYWFSNNNVTNSKGRIIFYLNASYLDSGQYNGRIVVGGQVLWFGFYVRSYGIMSYTNDWEYGITDTVEMNIKTRNIDDWMPLEEDGTVTITEIRRREPGQWMSENISFLGLGITNPVYAISSGEALIEMLANNTILNLDKPYEFELRFFVNLTESGVETGSAYFKLSNTAKPAMAVVDSTGEVPAAYFPGQQYTLQVTGPEGMTAKLRNIWGPQSQNYDQWLTESNGTLALNFTAPNQAGMYNFEVEVIREGSYPEYLNEQLLLGSGLVFEAKTEQNIMPGMNFSVTIHLNGEGDDPFCTGMHCGDYIWYGPLTNKTILLSRIKNLNDFTSTDVSSLGISVETGSWPASMLPNPDEVQADCGTILSQDECLLETTCRWGIEQECPECPRLKCMDRAYYCNNLNAQDCNSEPTETCAWDEMGESCYYQQYSEEDKESMTVMPGDAYLTINPNQLGLEAGNKYDLIFTYDDGEEVHEAKAYVQVEKFHVAISRKVENVGAKSEQKVWVKTQNLSGLLIPNCTIQFSSIFSELDQKVVKSLSINGRTDVNGEYQFTYIAPSLPGDYLVNGKAFCNLSNTEYRQDISYYINVGARNLEVDMKTKYKDGDSIKVAITTKDRLGEPKSQKLSLYLYHSRDDYDSAIYPESTSGCTAVEAANQNSEGGMANNKLYLQTDENGYLELELCPMPKGSYDLEIMPVFDYSMGGSSGNGNSGSQGENGYYGSFLISNIDVAVNSSMRYKAGDTVNLSILATTEYGEPVNATLTALAVMWEAESGSQSLEIPLFENYSLGVPMEGLTYYSFTIPETVTGIINNEEAEVPVTIGPVFLKLMIDMGSDTVETWQGMQFALVRNENSSLTTDATVLTNSMISSIALVDNNDMYKVQYGGFFFKDNPDQGKDWQIENGVLMKHLNGQSYGRFRILTPSEPGKYILGIPVIPADEGPNGDEDWNPFNVATEVLISEIEVKLDSVNVTGTVLDLENNPVENTLISVGKSSTLTDSMGFYSIEVPKGTKTMTIEKKNGELKNYLKTAPISFNANKEINITFYTVTLAGELAQKLFNITSPSFDLSTTKLRMNVSIINNGNEALNDFSFTALANSGAEEWTESVDSLNETSIYLSKLYAGFENGNYQLKIIFEENSWEGDSYLIMNGLGVNSTIGSVLTKDYTVETYAVSGNGMDDDSDGRIDEEQDNNMDDDGDGLIDEDLEPKEYVEWCGNGFCSMSEYNANNCFEDCAKGTVCGNGNCESGEEYKCAQDCGEQTGACENKGMCLENGNFCNNNGLEEPVSWCQTTCDSDNCWACSVEDQGGMTECEQKGCAIGSDDFDNRWCYKNVQCDEFNCWACNNIEDCSATGVCNWREDQYSAWCERPWVCDVECGACADQSACEASPANMSGTGCRWKSDNWGSWCEWDFNYVPPSEGGQGIINNIWIADSDTTMDWQAAADYRGWSGNSGNGVTEGTYYIIMNMGTTNVNISVNGEHYATIENMGQYWRTIAVEVPYEFPNGTYDIEVRDLIGPDYINWSIVVGEPDETFPELYVEGFGIGWTPGSEFITTDLVFTDLSNSPICLPERTFGAQGVYQEWIVTFDTISDAGCNQGYPDCNGDDDYRIRLVADSDGNFDPTFEVWAPSLWQETSIMLPFDLLCNSSELLFYVNKTFMQVDDCDLIVARVITASSTPDRNVYHTLDNNQFQLEGECSVSVCGNGLLEEGEDCEINPLNLTGLTCTSEYFGGEYVGGLLNCTQECFFDSSSCIPIDPCVGYLTNSTCLAGFTCGWAGPPGGESCISCSVISSEINCNFAMGCYWNVTCKGDEE